MEAKGTWSPEHGEAGGEALRPGEELFRTFVRQSSDGIVIIDARGIILEWNEGEEEITGIRRAEAVGRPIWDVQHELVLPDVKTADRLRLARERVLRGLAEGAGVKRILEEEIQRRDGKRRIIQTIIFGIRNDRQILAGGICRDITERKRLEEDLRTRQALLLEAERAAHLGHWSRDLRSGASSWSDEAYRVLGYVPGAVAPSTAAFGRAVAPEDRERVLAGLKATARDGLPRRAEYRVITPQGATRCLHGTVDLLRDANGAPAWVIGTVQDFTERKEAEEALRDSQEDLSRAQAVAHVGSWRLDVRRNELHWSEETYRIFGVTQGAPMTYDTFLALVHTDDRELVDRHWQAALHGEPYDVEHRVVVGDTVTWVRERACLETDAEGRLSGGFGTVEDITDRKTMEREIANASRRKDQFLAMLSHELRNPLAAVLTSLHVLDRTESGGERSRRMHAIIGRQVSHLTRLVDDLLDVTRISRSKIKLRRERLELGGLVRSTLEDYRSTFTLDGVQLDDRIAPEPMWLDGDATRIAQVVGNLLTNAVKFTPRGGRVEVVVEPDGGTALLRVLDNGVGIPRDMLASIFEPFTQANAAVDRAHTGLGLGLAVVQGVVALHGGSVVAASEGPGLGAEFTVRLPLQATKAEPIAADDTRAARQPRRVLIIEDSVDAADCLREALALEGHSVDVAHNGPEGLDKARALPPDIVLCDIGLPGMDGYEVARRFRADAALKGTFLVALTGYGLAEDVRRAAEAGFDRHVTKPPDFAKLDEYLADSARRGAARAAGEQASPR